MLIFQTSNGGKWSEEKANSVSPKEKNIGENLGDLGYDNDFSDITSKVLSLKKNNW